jgi:hypothetical protein
MEVLFAIAIAVIAMLGLDFAASAWGVDSRPGLADDHRR